MWKFGKIIQETIIVLLYLGRENFEYSDSDSDNDKIDDEDHFLYFFTAQGPCIREFHNTVWPVLAIDETFLKEKYCMTIFVVVTMDENNEIYPVAFGVVDSNNDAS